MILSSRVDSTCLSFDSTWFDSIHFNPIFGALVWLAGFVSWFVPGLEQTSYISTNVSTKRNGDVLRWIWLIHFNVCALRMLVVAVCSSVHLLVSKHNSQNCNRTILLVFSSSKGIDIWFWPILSRLMHSIGGTSWPATLLGYGPGFSAPEKQVTL